MLGPVAAAELREAQALRARRWAAAAAPDVAFEATTAGAVFAALAGEHEGPLLLVAPDVPGLDEQHLAAALEDLADGAALVRAPSHDGTPWFLAFPRLDADLFAAPDASPAALERTVASVPGAVVGFAGAERRLRTPDDARALAADPLAPAELVAILRAVLPVRRVD